MGQESENTMPMYFFDSDCHWDRKEFATDEEAKTYAITSKTYDVCFREDSHEAIKIWDNDGSYPVEKVQG